MRSSTASTCLEALSVDSLLTTEDVANFFRLDVVTIRRMIGKGELPAYRVGGEYRFKRSDIDEYLERQRVPAKMVDLEPGGWWSRQTRKRASKASTTEAFGRFTKRARTALSLAQEEAADLNHGYIGTEHLLLGLLREGRGVGGQLFSEMGCGLEDVRQAVREQVGPGPDGETASGERRVTPRLKMVLEYANDEAKRLDHAHVGTEHLLLGLLREGEGIAGRLLADRGLDLNTVRSRIRDLAARRAAR